MTIRIAPAEVSRLSDDRLMTALRETIAEAKRRPHLAPVLKQYLADELAEFAQELLAPSALTPEQIVAMTEPSALRLGSVPQVA